MISFVSSIKITIFILLDNFFWIAVPAVVIVNGANTFFASGNQKFVNQLKHLKQQIIHLIEFFCNYFRNVFNNFKLAEK